jgi:hypothetical protein
VLVAALVAAGVVVAVVLSGGDELSATLDRCRIQADGTMVAAGSVRGDAGSTATIGVEFRDTSDGRAIEDVRVTVEVPDGGSAPWRATGRAGDDVRRITCVVTDVEG